MCQFDELWYAVGFDDSSETHYCLADKNMNCKEYLAEDGVENAGCYQSSLSTDSTEILSCGDHHLDVWGCSGYDGCGKGQHWCKYLEENTTRWVILEIIFLVFSFKVNKPEQSTITLIFQDLGA